MKDNIKMRMDVISRVPQLLNSMLSSSLAKRARTKNLVKIYVHDIRMYGLGKHRQIDDYPYGVKCGMVLKIEPIEKCLEKLKAKIKYDEIIFITPDGEIFMQNIANKLSSKKNLIILCGHSKGIDQRIRENFITREISIGNYVLSGGELAAAVLLDSILRLIPGVLNNERSALTDSFQNNLLEPPLYTRPIKYKKCKVPKILRSGKHKELSNWKYKQSIKKTKKYLLDNLKKINTLL